MFSIVTAYFVDTVPFVCHHVTALNIDHCKILAFDIVKRHFGSMDLLFVDQGGDKWTITTEKGCVGCVGYGEISDLISGGILTVRI